METRSHRVLTIGIVILIVIVAGIYFFMLYKKATSGVALKCGVMEVTLTPEFTTLAKPAELKTLNSFGCYEAEDGCSCAKISPDGQGIVFGIARTSDDVLKIPETKEEQKTFLTSLGNYVKANSIKGTAVSSEMGTYKNYDSVVVKSIGRDSMERVIESRNMYFIYNGALINVTFQSDQKNFLTYWPHIEQSLSSTTFVK